MSAAPAAPAIRDFLINGWMQTLRQPDVRDHAHQILLGWARAAHEGRLNRTTTFGILTDVRNAHTPLDAMFPLPIREPRPRRQGSDRSALRPG